MTEDTFSRRAGISSEYSGPDEASPKLRARLRAVVERYLADEHHLGIGSDGWYVHTRELHYRLSMRLGREIRPNHILNIIDGGDWNEVFEAIEAYLEVAAKTAYQHDFRKEIREAFALSGSVYYVDKDDRVKLAIEEETAKRIALASKSLGSSAERAKQIFDEAVGGLLSRKMRPQDVVKDVHIAFEEYLQQLTGAKDFEGAVKALQNKGLLNKAQVNILGRLYGYRSEGFGTTHAGEEATPKEADALWYVETVATQVTAADRVVKGRTDLPERSG